MISQNFHTHTFRCHHAEGTDRDYVEAAVKAGLKTLGFSDHCPMRYNNKDHVSYTRMLWSEFDEYRESILALKEEYASKIEILLGLECEYNMPFSKDHFDLLESGKVDYLLLAGHFVGGEESGIVAFCATEDEEILSRYVDEAIEALRTGYYKYMAHPDCINFVGDDAVYIRHMLRLCDEFGNLDLPVELNWLGIGTGRNYTSKRFLSIAGEAGLTKYIHGIDAHSPAHILNESVYRKACELADFMTK